MTEKLYNKNSYISEFVAEILEIVTIDNRKAIVLDKTAFFPEGGGQPSDEGFIENTFISHVLGIDGVVYHFGDVKGRQVGETVNCRIDFELRFARMQSHSGEHIVSGLVFSQYAFDNVGFHMDDCLMTVDFNGVLTKEMLKNIEEKANECIYKNVKINAEIVSSDKLKALQYRSKLDLTENVRIVTIEGYDKCACCAPHVSSSGEIGIIKILSSISHRGGTRIAMICGKTAYEDYVEKFSQVLSISNLLAAKQNEVSDAVNALALQNKELKNEILSLKAKYNKFIVENTTETQGNAVVFCDELDMDSLRDIAIGCSEKCKGVSLALSGKDDKGYSYALISNNADVASFSKDINTALSGRGGGRGNILQGRLSADRKTIEQFFEKFSVV